MNLEILTEFTAVVLGFIAVLLARSAGVALLGTCFTISPDRLQRLKARALKHLMVAAPAGAASAAMVMAME